MRVRRIARRKAADCSFGSGRSPEWTSMTKAELTAENRPAYKDRLDNSRSERRTTYKNQGGIEVLVVLLDIVGVVLGRLPLVHRVEVQTSVVVLDRLEECSESILETMDGKRDVVKTRWDIERTTLGQSVVEGRPFHPLRPFPLSCPSLPSDASHGSTRLGNIEG